MDQVINYTSWVKMEQDNDIIATPFEFLNMFLLVFQSLLNGITSFLYWFLHTLYPPSHQQWDNVNIFKQRTTRIFYRRGEQSSYCRHSVSWARTLVVIMKFGGRLSQKNVILKFRFMFYSIFTFMYYMNFITVLP